MVSKRFSHPSTQMVTTRFSHPSTQMATTRFSHHHHHASLLKSSIKQEACFGAWAQSASFSLSLSLGVWALCASLSQHHNAVQSVRPIQRIVLIENNSGQQH
jgi:hypothetical protein